MEYGLIVTVLCLVVVFGVLAFLILALYAMEYLMKRKTKVAESGAKETQDQPVQSIEIEETDGRIIAVITAALQAYYEAQPENKKANFIVRSIKRI